MSKAIPTTYGRTAFRSRLEAHWAAMFDICGWRWEYEPVDLNGYIPDFVLRFPAGLVLAEVKPGFDTAELTDAAAAKINASGWQTENVNHALIVGSSWSLTDAAWPDAGDYSDPIAGCLRQTFGGSIGENGEPVFGECYGWSAAQWHRCHACDKPSLHHLEGVWSCLICGGADGDRYLKEIASDSLESAWRSAGNRCQWEPLR